MKDARASQQFIVYLSLSITFLWTDKSTAQLLERILKHDTLFLFIFV